MHIPDGYLSPMTCVVMYGAAVPFWYRASQRVKQVVSTRMIPMLSMFAAFSFVIQMFNIPVPGGTTAHAVGGTLVAIVLGPWAAVIGVSVSLIIQAIFFGDGGITAIGANSFNLAVALPLTGYAAYRMASGSLPSPRRRVIAAAVGAYVGINVAGLLTAIELGLQPLLSSEGGRALYNPYGLEATVPAMLITHLTIAGFAEAAVTALVVAYVLRAFPGLLDSGVAMVADRELGKVGWAMAGVLVVLAVFAPLGLLAPGVAEFEWSAGELAAQVGYVPSGLAELSDIWRLAPLPDYGLPWLDSEAGFLDQAVGYVLSAVFGIGIFLIVALAVSALVRARSRLTVRGPARRVLKSLARNLSYRQNAGVDLSVRPGDVVRGTSVQVALRSHPRSGATLRISASGFVGKTVSGITQALERSVFSEEQARRPGMLQQIDPRVKLLALLALVVVVGLSRYLPVIVGIYFLSLLMALASRLSLAAFLKRSLLGIPLFAVLIVLPSLFVVPGHQLLSFRLTEGIVLGISDNGLHGAAVLIARVSASVSLAMLLVLTTRWADLLKSLQALHVPRAFVMVLGMTYRYLFLLLRLTNDMFLARASRTVGPSTGGQNRRWVAGPGGSLVGKSLKVSEDVYMAMLSRGFAGEVRTICAFKTRESDWLFAGVIAMIAAVALLVDGGLV